MIGLPEAGGIYSTAGLLPHRPYHLALKLLFPQYGGRKLAGRAVAYWTVALSHLHALVFFSAVVLSGRLDEHLLSVKVVVNKIIEHEACTSRAGVLYVVVASQMRTLLS